METNLTVLQMSQEELARLPLCLHIIYCKPTVTQMENETTKLYSCRAAGQIEQMGRPHKPISKPFVR